MNGETAAFDIDEELAALWQKAYGVVRDVVRQHDGAEIVFRGGVRSAKVDKDGLLLLREEGGAYELAECFSDNTMFAVLRDVVDSQII